MSAKLSRRFWVPRIISPNRKTSSVCFIAMLLLCCCLFPAICQAQFRIGKIVDNSDPPPTGGGTIFSSLNPVINDSGQVAFRGLVSGGNSLDGLFLGSEDSALIDIFRQGTNSPDGNGTIGPNFGSSHLNNNGLVSVATTLNSTNLGTLDNSVSLFGDGNTISIGFHENQTIPDGSAEFSTISEPELSDSGSVIVFNQLRGATVTTTNDRGIFLNSGGSIAQIAREDDALPNGGDGDWNALGLPAINASGQFTFSSSLRNTTLGFANDNALFTGTSAASLTELAREGDLTPDGISTFITFSNPLINNAGEISVRAFTSIGHVLYRATTGGTFTEIVRASDSAPNGNGTFSSIDSFGSAINNSGQIIFAANFTATSGGTDDDRGIILSTGSEILQIVREGQPAPDGNGTFLVVFANAANLSDSGVVLFLDGLANTTGGSSDDRGYFLADGQEIITLAREGDEFLGSTITGVSVQVGPNRGGRSGINKFSQVAVDIGLADGRNGIYILTPELHWRSTSGSWDDDSRWTLGLHPGDEVYDVIIDRDSTTTVTGPANATTIRSLKLGGRLGAAILRTNAGGDLTITGNLQIVSGSVLDHEQGTLTTESVTNAGNIDIASPMIVTATLTNTEDVDIFTSGTLTTSEFINHRTVDLTGGIIVGQFTNELGGLARVRGLMDGAVTNSGTFDLTGFLQVTGVIDNTGSIIISTAESLQIDSALDNTGVIDLNGGAITGTGTVNNQSGGIIRGGSGISSPVTNSGGLIHANKGTVLVIADLTGGNINGGELRIDDGSGMNIQSAFSSSGTIVLNGANATLSGGTINNSNVIRGSGRIENVIANNGTIRAEGGTLTLSAASMTSTNSSTIEVSDQSTLLITQGLAINNGFISLLGGAFDNGQNNLDNQGTITGFGVLRTTGLTNNGLIGVGGGSLQVIGPVTSNTTISVETGFDVIFHGDVDGSGSYPGSGAVLYLGDYSPGASPAAISFGGDVQFFGGSQLTMELGGTVAGSQFDQLNIAGQASFSGTMSVELIDGFKPSPGDQFVLFNYGSLQGTFDTLQLPDFDPSHPDLAWEVSYDTESTTLTFLGLPGDIDFSGTVDSVDLSLFIQHYGNNDDADWEQGDFNDDGKTDLADLLLLKQHFGNSYSSAVPSPTVVPEPASLTLALLAGVCLLWSVRRKRCCLLS